MVSDPTHWTRDKLKYFQMAGTPGEALQAVTRGQVKGGQEQVCNTQIISIISMKLRICILFSVLRIRNVT